MTFVGFTTGTEAFRGGWRRVLVALFNDKQGLRREVKITLDSEADVEEVANRLEAMTRYIRELED